MVGSLLSAIGSRRNIPFFVAFALIAGAVLAWLAPVEATLGQAVKLVYFHAALMWTAFGLLTMGGLLGVAYLVTRRPAVLAWSNGSASTAAGLLLATGLFSLATAWISWGGIYWAEPRLLMLGQILLVGAIAAFVPMFGGPAVAQAAANSVFTVVAWALVLRTELVVHPANPIFTSESAAIKIFPLLITACLAFAGLQIVRYRVLNN